MNFNSRMTQFSRNLWLTVSLFIILIITFAIYVWSESEVTRANELRHDSLLLANELRQSTDDLTRMARTYVMTGNPIWKKFYQDIIDIRDGKQPRPEKYHRPYWNLILTDGKRPRPDSTQTIALLDLMRQQGFTESEFNKLTAAKKNADALIAIEFEAMTLVESVGANVGATRDQAQRMMYDDKYLQGRAAIMKPIDQFYEMIDIRTLNSIQAHEVHVLIMRYIFMAFGLLAMFMLWQTYRALQKTMGGSVDEVQSHIARIGSGDFSSTIPLDEAKNNSVLGWLSEMQRKLNDNEKRFEQLFRAVSIPLCLVDQHGVIELRNHRFVKTFGYTKEEVPSLNEWWPLAYPDPNYRKWVLTSWAVVVETSAKQGVDIEPVTYNVTCKNGEILTVEISGITIGDYLLTTFFDVTDRKNAEELLRAQNEEIRAQNDALQRINDDLEESEEKFRVMAETSLDLIFQIDTQGIFTYCSPSADTLLAYEPQEMIGKPFANFVTPDTLPIANEIFLDTLAGQKVRLVNLMAYRKTGEAIWLEVSTAPMLKVEQVIGVQGNARDITERKLAEKTLRESEEFTRRLIESSKDCIKVLDLDGRMLSMSAGGQKLLEIDNVTCYLGLNWVDFWKGSDRAGALQAVLTAEQGQAATFYGFCETAKGTPKWWEVIVSPITNASGKIDRLLAISRDITERKLAEEVLKAREIQLKELNATKDKLFSIIAHDLRGPFSAILGFSELLLDSMRTNTMAESEQMLRDIYLAATNTFKLLNTLLDWAKTQTNQVNIHLNSLNISVIIEEVLSQLTSVALNKGVLLNYDQPQDAMVYADQNMLHTILRNLISNSIKYTNAGGAINISITSNNDYVEVSVADNGVGMNEEIKNQLFTSNVNPSTYGTANEKGTGLGLVICKEFVVKQRGHIWVDSEVGKGSIFKFTIPTMNLSHYS